MSDDDSNRSAAGEPFAWGFYQQLPGRLGSVTLCTVRSREEADDLREQGIEIFPLYSEAALRHPPEPVLPDETSQGVSWPGLGSALGLGRQPTTENQTTSDTRADPRPPLPPDIFGLPSGNVDRTPPASEAPWTFNARARSGWERGPPPPANNPAPGGPGIPASQNSLIREVLRPFAEMAALVEGQEEDETVLSLQSGPLQWKHLTVGDLRRARSLYLASDG